jgi:hypothetical protein
LLKSAVDLVADFMSSVLQSATKRFQRVTGATSPKPLHRSGPWELAVAEGGASAFKVNTRTGEMFFCHRQSCFKSVEAQAFTNPR